VSEVSTSVPSFVQSRALANARRAHAEELIRAADTVTLLTCAEVTELYRRADAGEFDEDVREETPGL
jgi:hypothetical protein